MCILVIPALTIQTTKKQALLNPLKKNNACFLNIERKEPVMPKA